MSELDKESAIWWCGVLTTLIALPLFFTLASGNKIKLFQGTVIVPFFPAFLAGATFSIYRIINGGWQVWDEILAFFTGVALVVIIVKSIRRTLGPSKGEDDY